jgi:hypothetical protein
VVAPNATGFKFLLKKNKMAGGMAQAVEVPALQA